MDAALQPSQEVTKPTIGNLAVEVGELALGLGHQLRSKHIAQRVGRKIADKTAAPVNILQHPFGIRRRPNAKVVSKTFVPSGRQIGHSQLPQH